VYQVSAFYNQPVDRAAFDAHYLNVHRKIAERLPDIVHFTVNWPEPVTGDGIGPIHCAALMYWAEKDAATAALTSPVGVEAMNDMPNFAGAGATMAMSQSEVKVPFSTMDERSGDGLFTALELHGHPEDASVFDLYYREVHGQSLEHLCGLTSYTMNWTEPGPDGSAAPYHLVSALEWNSKDDMVAAVTGPVLSEAAIDLENYAGRGLQTLACRTLRVV
jgi:uncharacterized protein (TIGR02118 family)